MKGRCITLFLTGLLLLYTASVEADTLVGSFHLQTQTSYANQESAAGLATRTSGGDAGTQGLVPGAASYLVGHTIGQDGYNGAQINIASGSSSFNDMTRYAGTTSGGIVFWDFDLSEWASGKDIGSQVGLSLKLNYTGRRTSATYAAPIYISYNNGSGLTRDTTVTTSQSTGTGVTYGILSNTAHFVPIGQVPDEPQADGIVEIDITSHLLASTDQTLRIALFVTEYYGDITLLSGSGLIESAASTTNRLELGSETSWHDWDTASLSAVSIVNGDGVLTNAVAFDGTHAVQYNYTNNSSITFPYRYAGSSIYYGGRFFTSLFDPNASSNETYLIEFIDNGVVQSIIALHPHRPFWNRCEVYQRERYDIFRPLTPVGLSISTYIPRDPDFIRIKPPQGRSGTLYIGKLFLGTDAKWSELNLQGDRVTALITASVPATPPSVTVLQSNDLAQIRTRLDEIYGVAPYTASAALPVATMDDLRTRYQAYAIQWNSANGIWSGNNPMMYTGSLDYDPYEKDLGDLMLEVAQGYRNSTDASQRNELKQIFFDLFDFSECIGGIPDSWAAGITYLPAIFLMRSELSDSGRLTPEMRSTYRDRIGFNRAYLDYSWFAKTGIGGWDEAHSSRDIYREGELGENVDYLRIISIQLVLNALLNPTEEACVRDLQAVSGYFSNIAFQVAPGTIDGFRPDGLAYHHWGWVQQYGTDCLVKMPRIIYALAGTEFKISESAHTIVRHAIESLDWMCLYSIMPNTLTGKGGFPYTYGGNGHHTADPYAYLALSGTPDGTQAVDAEMAEIFQRSYNDFLPNTSAPSAFATQQATLLSGQGYTQSPMPAGTRIYSYGNVVAHRKNDWLWTIKGHSKFQFTRESSDPWVTYLGYGMLDRVADYWVRYGATRLVTEFGVNGYDWRKYPGTTTVDFADIQSIVNQEYKRYWSTETFCGGVEQGTNGLFALKIKGSALNGLDSYRARKSWFFFDGTVVAMGSGISNTVAAEPTITTLYQDKITSSTPTHYNSTSGITGLSTDTTTVLSAPAWMVDSAGTGYWVPAGSSLTVMRRNQTNPNWDNAASVSGDFALAWINHGNAPSGASYWYVQSPDSSPTAMSSFSAAMNGATPPFQSLKHTDSVHAVWSEAQQTYGITVFDSSSPVAVRDIKSVSRPCTLMVHEMGLEARTLSIADPDIDLLDHTVYSNNESWGTSQAHTLTAVLNGLWHITAPPANLTTVLTDTVADATTITMVVKEGLTSDIELVAMTPDNAFGLWLDSHGIGTVSTTNDADSDGVLDIYEYAYNMNPNSNDVHQLIPITGTSGLPAYEIDTSADPVFNVIYLRRRNALDLAYNVEFTSNLISNDWVVASDPGTIASIDAGWEQVKVGDTDAPPNATNRFGRVRLDYSGL